MKSSWVVNASPLILLAKIGRIDLLSDLTEKLVIPASLCAEVQAGPAVDPARQWLRGAGAQWVRPDAPGDPAVAAWDLGAGETAVLNWRVVLTTPIPSERLEAGDVGTVVHIHQGGVGYGVEFAALAGETVAVVKLLASQVRPIAWRDLTHARPWQLA